MASNFISYVCTDTNTTIQFTFKDSAGNPVNITGCTIRFSIRKESTTSNTNDSSNTCSLITPTSGVFGYTFNSGDCPTPGTYNAQIHITFPGGSVHRVPKFIYISAIESYL